ncbi:S8 family serine peptidase [Planosporangium sp. 12N6]|uniref:S8 family serine peptidase n=1 Tax=Planosporangium spinosum TaxID=3402278 RepID=UPI003CF6336F
MTDRRPRHRAVAVGVVFTAATAALGVASGGAAFAERPEGTVRGAHLAGAVKDSYIVVLRDSGADPGSVRSTAATLSRVHGGVVKRTYSTVLKGYLAQMSEAQAKRVAARPEVAYVEQNHVVRATAVQPTPPSWGLDRIDQPYLPLDRSYTSPDAAGAVRVYVIDSGINIAHQEFGGRAGYGQNFTYHKSPTEAVDPADASDCMGHGTHVAATIGGRTYGVARNAQLVAVRVLDCAGNGTDADVIAGIDWVRNDPARAGVPAVANMSIGGVMSTAINDAVKAATAAGVTFTVAAGNDSVDSCLTSPASVPEAITVGATDQADRRAPFSNFGSCVDVFAPGVDITSAWTGSSTATKRISGTSMATPHVAGAAALLLAANRALTPAQVQAAIVGGAATGVVADPGVGSPNRLLQVGAAAVRPGTVIRLRAGANDKVVTAESAGASALVANRVAAAFWEEFDVVDAGVEAGVRAVALRAHANGRYVTAESAGARPLIANRTAIGPWEKFQLLDNGGAISLKALVNGRYVTAESAGARPLIANRTAIGPWEKFTVAVAQSTVCLLSFAAGDPAPDNLSGVFVTAEWAGAGPLMANRDGCGPWETFDAVDLGNGYLALRAHANGAFVTAESAGAGPLIANRTAIGPWEQFQLVAGGRGTFGLKARANGRYVSAEATGKLPLKASRTTAGRAETFTFVSP